MNTYTTVYENLATWAFQQYYKKWSPKKWPLTIAVIPSTSDECNCGSRRGRHSNTPDFPASWSLFVIWKKDRHVRTAQSFCRPLSESWFQRTGLMFYSSRTAHPHLLHTYENPILSRHLYSNRKTIHLCIGESSFLCGHYIIIGFCKKGMKWGPTRLNF